MPRLPHSHPVKGHRWRRRGYIKRNIRALRYECHGLLCKTEEKLIYLFCITQTLRKHFLKRLTYLSWIRIYDCVRLVMPNFRSRKCQIYLLLSTQYVFLGSAA